MFESSSKRSNEERRFRSRGIGEKRKVFEKIQIGKRKSQTGSNDDRGKKGNEFVGGHISDGSIGAPRISANSFDDRVFSREQTMRFCVGSSERRKSLKNATSSRLRNAHGSGNAQGLGSDFVASA